MKTKVNFFLVCIVILSNFACSTHKTRNEENAQQKFQIDSNSKVQREEPKNEVLPNTENKVDSNVVTQTQPKKKMCEFGCKKPEYHNADDCVGTSIAIFYDCQIAYLLRNTKPDKEIPGMGMAWQRGNFIVFELYTLRALKGNKCNMSFNTKILVTKLNGDEANLDERYQLLLALGGDICTPSLLFDGRIEEHIHGKALKNKK
jgi:hypothetical protein